MHTYVVGKKSKQAYYLFMYFNFIFIKQKTLGFICYYFLKLWGQDFLR